MIRTAEPVSTRSAPHEAGQDTAAYAIPSHHRDTAPVPPSPLPGTAAITITHGPGVSAPIEIPLMAGATLIGRHQDCDVVLTDMTVSRRHAEIRRIGHTFAVADLGSLNGTYVNRTPIDHVPLADGDVVLIGAFRLVFRSSQAEAAPGWSR